MQDALAHFGRIDLLVNNAGSRPGPGSRPSRRFERSRLGPSANRQRQGHLSLLARRGPAPDRSRRRRQDHQHVLYGRPPRISALRRVLHIQIRHHRLYPNPSPASWPLTGSTSTPSAQATPSPSAPTTSLRASPSATSQTPDTTAALVHDLEAQTPFGRIGTPEDVARTVAFLASDEAEYLTGVSMLVAGGFQM